MDGQVSFTRFASFEAGGRRLYGTVGEDGVRPVSDEAARRHPTLRDALAAGALAWVAETTQAPVPFDALRLLPPVPEPGKIICVGRNYAAHAAESGQAPPAQPSIFLKVTDTLVAHGGAVVVPRLSAQLDYEGELAIVIGKSGRHIPESEALGHLAGYSCFMDGSVRDVQFGHSLAAGKNFPATAGFGPWLSVPRGPFDPARCRVSTRLNGVEMQSAGVDAMIFTVEQIIAYVSAVTPLAPGDVIATGTPDGVGFARKPPVWIKAGDVVEVDIGDVGMLRLSVEDET